MSESEEKFKIKAEITQILDQFRDDLGRCENGVIVKCEIVGHSELFHEVFVEVFDTSEEVMKRVLGQQIEMSKYVLATKYERKLRGDFVDQLGHLKGMTVINEDCCFDCVKRQIGLLPPEITPSATYVEEISEVHEVKDI